VTFKHKNVCTWNWGFQIESRYKFLVFTYPHHTPHTTHTYKYIKIERHDWQSTVASNSQTDNTQFEMGDSTTLTRSTSSYWEKQGSSYWILWTEKWIWNFTNWEAISHGSGSSGKMRMQDSFRSVAWRSDKPPVVAKEGVTLLNWQWRLPEIIGNRNGCCNNVLQANYKPSRSYRKWIYFLSRWWRPRLLESSKRQVFTLHNGSKKICSFSFDLCVAYRSLTQLETRILQPNKNLSEFLTHTCCSPP